MEPPALGDGAASSAWCRLWASLHCGAGACRQRGGEPKEETDVEASSVVRISGDERLFEQPPHCDASPQREVSRHPPSFLPGVRAVQAIRAFARSTAAQPREPTEVELGRGVQVEPMCDYYDPATKRIRVRKLDQDAVHVRTVESTRSISKGSRAVEQPDSASSTPRSSSGSEASGFGALGGALGARGAFRSERSQGPNYEALSRWGTVVGQMLHSRVLDFTTLNGRAVRKKRIKMGEATTMEAGKGTVNAGLIRRVGLVARQALDLARGVAKESVDTLDSEWNHPDLLPYLFSTEYTDTLMLVAHAASRLLASQPVLALAKAPCRVFGDLHGQLRDLLLLLWAFGWPEKAPDTTIVFNGDFVDRGKHQLEVVGLLLSLKVLYPQRVWLVRGNHEDRFMNEKYGFKDECVQKLGSTFGPTTYDLFHSTFDRLPIACLVAEKVLVVHGGLGDGKWKLDALQTIRRPLTADTLLLPDNKWLFNILWSDPIEDDCQEVQEMFGVHESPRGGTAARFGWNITQNFCALNGLGLIVRSHQVKRGGRGYSLMHDNRLIRVFSARDYEGHGNDSAVLLIAPSGNDDGLLVVRPQVLRSVTKAREEAARRALEDPATFGQEDPAPAPAERSGSSSPRSQRASPKGSLSASSKGSRSPSKGSEGSAKAAKGSEAPHGSDDEAGGRRPRPRKAASKAARRPRASPPDPASESRSTTATSAEGPAKVAKGRGRGAASARARGGRKSTSHTGAGGSLA